MWSCLGPALTGAEPGNLALESSVSPHSQGSQRNQPHKLESDLDLLLQVLVVSFFSAMVRLQRL